MILGTTYRKKNARADRPTRTEAMNFHFPLLVPDKPIVKPLNIEIAESTP